jgi:hypothetical protein
MTAGKGQFRDERSVPIFSHPSENKASTRAARSYQDALKLDDKLSCLKGARWKKMSDNERSRALALCLQAMLETNDLNLATANRPLASNPTYPNALPSVVKCSEM